MSRDLDASAAQTGSVPPRLAPALVLLPIAVALASCAEDRALPLRPGATTGRDAAPMDDDLGLPPEDDAGGAVRPTGGPAVLPPADVEVVLPYLGAPAEITLRANVALERLDVHFSVDTTGSFDDEIRALQRSLSTQIIPRLRQRVDEVGIGVSRFEDFPVRPFGSSFDVPFELVTPITTSSTRAALAVRALLPLGAGGDTPESGVEALYQIATGEGLTLEGELLVPPFAPEDDEPVAGGVGFREGSLRVIVQVSDARAHDGPEYAAAGIPEAHDLSETLEALQALGARVLGIASNQDARSFLVRVAAATGATIPAPRGGCPTGLDGARREPDVPSSRCALVYDITPDGDGLDTAIVDGIVGLLDQLQFDRVYGRAVDDRLAFVQRIEAVSATGRPEPARADERPVDGFDDTFLAVSGDTEVVFRAVLRNTRVRPADYDQAFRVTLQVVGDGLVLEQTVVRVIVPRGRLDAGVADAGVDAGVELDAAADPDARGADDASAVDASAVDASAGDASVAGDSSAVDASAAGDASGGDVGADDATLRDASAAPDADERD